MSALKVRRDILTEADIREVKRVLAEFGNPKSNTALEKWFTLELDALLNYADWFESGRVDLLEPSITICAILLDIFDNNSFYEDRKKYIERNGTARRFLYKVSKDNHYAGDLRKGALTMLDFKSVQAMKTEEPRHALIVKAIKLIKRLLETRFMREYVTVDDAMSERVDEAKVNRSVSRALAELQNVNDLPMRNLSMEENERMPPLEADPRDEDNRSEPEDRGEQVDYHLWQTEEELQADIHEMNEENEEYLAEDRERERKVPVGDADDLERLDRAATRLAEIFREAIQQTPRDKYVAYACNQLASIALTFQISFGNVLLQRYENPAQIRTLFERLINIVFRAKNVFTGRTRVADLGTAVRRVDTLIEETKGIVGTSELTGNSSVDRLSAAFKQVHSLACFLAEHRLADQRHLFEEVYESVYAGVEIAIEALSVATPSNLVHRADFSQTEIEILDETQEALRATGEPEERKCSEALSQFRRDFAAWWPTRDVIEGTRQICVLWSSVFDRPDGAVADRRGLAPAFEKLSQLERKFPRIATELCKLTHTMLIANSTRERPVGPGEFRPLRTAIRLIKNLIDLRFPPEVKLLERPKASSSSSSSSS